MGVRFSGRSRLVYQWALLHHAPTKLASLYNASSTDEPQAEVLQLRTWMMGDMEVCFESWCAMIGSSKRTILKMLAQTPDMRHHKGATTQRVRPVCGRTPMVRNVPHQRVTSHLGARRG